MSSRSERGREAPGVASVWLHRVLVAGAAVATVLIAARAVPDFHLVPADAPRRFEATWLNLIFGGVAATVALFVVWKAGRKHEGQNLGLFLAVFGLCLALSVMPGNVLTVPHRIAFAAAWTAATVQILRFWASFPQPLDVDAAWALSRRRGGGWLGSLHRGSARLVATTLTYAWAKAAFAAIVLVWALGMVVAGGHQHNLLVRDNDLLNPLQLASISVTALFAILATVAFAWTSYRLAEPAQRRRMMWIVFAYVTIGFWTVMALVLLRLEGLTGPGVVAGLSWFFNRTYIPVTIAVNLAGFVVAIFYAGAFDLRPLINRTTVFGGAVLVLTVVFALVEELIQSQLADRLAIPEGLSTWIGAAAVAVALGPVRTWMERGVRRVGSELEARDEGSAAS